MASASYRTPPDEYAAIHRACCRYRAQGLVCSSCTELDERATRYLAGLAAALKAVA